MTQEPREVKIDIDTTSIKKEMKALTDAESRIKELEKEVEENKHKVEFFDKNSGQGTLPASLNDAECSKAKNNREYEGATMQEAYRAMIDDLKAKGDTETLNKLLAKGIGVFKTNFEVKDDWKDGTSAIRKQLDKMNAQARPRGR
jgi:hypothetical protein